MWLLRFRIGLSLNLNKRNGFSLVELMVTIGIFITVTSLVFANYPKFRSQLTLKKTSQEIALAVREAQVYGLSVREYDGVFPGYGIHFNINKPGSVLIFADLNDSKGYDPNDGIVKEYAIQTKDAISDLCGETKKSPPGSCNLSQLDAVYLRPNPVVTLRGKDRDGVTLPDFSDTEIKISSLGGEEKTIILWLSGQITIE